MKLADESLLNEFRAARRCELCRRGTPSGCDPCHLMSRGAGRVDLRCNIVAACRACHQLSHTNPAVLAQMFEIAARRERMTVEQIRDVVHRVRRCQVVKVWDVAERGRILVMTKAEASAAFLQGYWSALLIHGITLPVTLKPHLSLAQLMLERPSDVAFCTTLLAEMVATVEEIEDKALAANLPVERN